jgi:hypothetical protein
MQPGQADAAPAYSDQSPASVAALNSAQSDLQPGNFPPYNFPPNNLSLSNLPLNNLPVNQSIVSNGAPIIDTVVQPETAITQTNIDLPMAITIPLKSDGAVGESAVASQANSAATVNQVRGSGSGDQMAGAAGISQVNSASGANQPAGKTESKQVSGTNASMNPSPANAAGAPTNKSASAANSSHDAPSHDGQNTQSSDTSPSAQPASPGSVNNNLSQAQTQATVPSAPVHDTASPAPHLSGALADAARPTDQRDLSASHSETGMVATTPEIRSATLVNALNGTEMRVGMQSSEFGDISIRTVMLPKLLRTQISLDHGELSQVLSTHVSATQAKLGDDFGLHASIEINNAGTSLQGNPDQSSQRQQSSQHASTPGSMQAAGDATPTALGNGTSPEIPAVLANGHQLDIRV